MFRAIVTRAARRPVITAGTRLSRNYPRWNSSQPPQADTSPPLVEPSAKASRDLKRKAALERADNLQRDWDANEVSYAELLPKTRSPSPDSYLIDVREPDEAMQGMIPSAVNLPLSVLGNALHTNYEGFKEQYGFEKPNIEQEIIFYCRSGQRSTTACDVAKRNGYTNVLNYKGSWIQWVQRQKGS